MEERFRAEVTPVSVTQTKSGRYVFRGVASTTGNVDRMRRCFLPGAFGAAKAKVPLLANHDEHQVLGSSTLTPSGDRLLHESSVNPKARMADEMIALLSEGDIASTSISWLSDQRYHGWSDLRRRNPELAVQAAALGVPQAEDVVYFGNAEIVENSVVPIPANDRALIGVASLLSESERGYVESMREVASLAGGRLPVEQAAGARHSQRDMALIQSAHDALSNLGATCTVTTDNSEDVEDNDDAQDREQMNQSPPLGGWTDDVNPRGSVEGAEQAADTPRFSMPDGSYPINSCSDVSAAARLAHHSKTYSFAEVKAHVLKAKSALNCTDSVLPDTWNEDNQSSMPLPSELESLDRELAELAGRFSAS